MHNKSHNIIKYAMRRDVNVGRVATNKNEYRYPNQLTMGTKVKFVSNELNFVRNCNIH